MLECADNIFFLICNADNIFKGFHGSCSNDGLPFGREGGWWWRALCQLLQHLPAPDSVTLKMAAGHSSETVGHTFTTWFEYPQNDH